MKHLLDDISKLHRIYNHPCRSEVIDFSTPRALDEELELRNRLVMRLRLVMEESMELFEACLLNRGVPSSAAALQDRHFTEVLISSIGRDIEAMLAAHSAKAESVTDNVDAFLTREGMVTVADALADIIVVCVGMALELGIPLDRVWAEVQRSNLAKRAADGSVRRRPDGKVLKPDGWTPPDIERALQEPTQASWAHGDGSEGG